MLRRFKALVLLPTRFHFWGSLLIVLFVGLVISRQITDRRGFANSELYEDVMDRWGAPISLPSPSLRWVGSGAVFNTLQAQPLERQRISVDARMSYRRRGLVYFSGFDFGFQGSYGVRNRQLHPIDIVFVFPINMQKNKVLLSDLRFAVNGKPAAIDLGADNNKLIWTGRLEPDQTLDFDIAFSGRGLDSLVYELDPQLPVRDFSFDLRITGGDNYDYPAGVVPASEVDAGAEPIALRWSFASLESGVPVGVILPSERAWDHIIATLVGRSWVPFILLFAGVALLGLRHGRRLRFYESYLLAACYGFTFVLLAYLAAFMSFYLALVISLLVVGLLLWVYLRAAIHRSVGPYVLGYVVAYLAVPSLAVVAQGYTGLIYSLEILAGLGVLIALVPRPSFRALLEKAWETTAPIEPPEPPKPSGPATPTEPPAPTKPPAPHTPTCSGSEGAPPAGGGRATAAVLVALVLATGVLMPRTALAEGEGSSATLPLEQVLSLHRQLDDARRPSAKAPPVAASVDRMELTGRLYDGGVDLTALVTVRVLSTGQWVQVELLDMDADTAVSALPELETGTILARDGKLSFLTQTAGSYSFAVSLRKRAQVQGLSRSVQLRPGPATLAVLNVVLDEDLFRLDSDDPVRTTDGVQLFPRQGRFVLRWARREQVAVREEPAQRRPPQQPVVPVAHASVVSTLEGQQFVRLHYALSFEGSRPIQVQVPRELRLDKVLLNGALQPFELDGQTLSLTLTPARAGDRAGVLELVLLRSQASFNLSGSLHFRLPTVSWPVHELLVRAHLPAVFNYTWAGGSLAPPEAGRAVPEVTFTQTMPEPGKPLMFRQVLVGALTPDLRLDYTIDLEGQYFQGRVARPSRTRGH